MSPQADTHPPSPDTVDSEIGEAIHALASEIYPICRSITGAGVRQTLDILARHIDLRRVEIPTGTRLFDWTVPKEWNIREAWIKDASGHRIVDFAENNLHVVNYSAPIHATVGLDELKRHVHTLPQQPDLIPYRTSYYAETWGFCMAHRQFEALPDGPYEVRVDAELSDGHLTYGEYLHRGESEREFLLSAHICHPSLANDNCSGLALLTLLAQELSRRSTRLSYRFIFAPGTIGALAWLHGNETAAARIDHGLIVSCVGDGGGPTYKRSRQGDAFIDRAMACLLRDSQPRGRVLDFFPYGYDERQYCSPGFNLPVGLFQRSLFGTFREYHTSADNLSFIRPRYLGESYHLVRQAIEIAEGNWTPLSLCPMGEPQLGRRGLYAATGGRKTGQATMALLWVLNLADGRHSLLAMAERSGLPYAEIADAAQRLHDDGLLGTVSDQTADRPAPEG